MLQWYQDEVVFTGRQPVFLAFVAFLLTLVATRVIVRMIRAGKGPFRNVDTGGVHVHHVIPGIILMGIGGLMGMSASGAGILKDLAGILFGMGCALVLDEFALILHLDDVYWEKEGRLSVEAASVAMVVMLMAVVVAAPNNQELPSEFDTPAIQWLSAALFAVFWVAPAGVCLLKGKIFTAAVSLTGIGLFLVWIGSMRVAKPASPWARARYAEGSKKMIKAQRRKAAEDRRTAPIRNAWARLVFGFDGTEVAKAEGGREAQALARAGLQTTTSGEGIAASVVEGPDAPSGSEAPGDVAGGADAAAPKDTTPDVADSPNLAATETADRRG
jgi:hypothetical protein